MPAPLRIKLTPEEDQALFELRHNTALPRRTRERAEILRLNARGWRVTQIAEYLDWEMQAVRKAIYRWQARGIEGLGDAPGRGDKPRYTEEDLAYLEHYLIEPRTYNSKQLAQKLAEERNVHLSADRLRRILKKRIIGGKEREWANPT
jgi:transposase